MSDENKILVDKSMLERYRKCKCCVFIDFEYIFKSNLSPKVLYNIHVIETCYENKNMGQVGIYIEDGSFKFLRIAFYFIIAYPP